VSEDSNLVLSLFSSAKRYAVYFDVLGVLSLSVLQGSTADYLVYWLDPSLHKVHVAPNMEAPTVMTVTKSALDPQYLHEDDEKQHREPNLKYLSSDEI
jgi:hypothetical protein